PARLRRPRFIPTRVGRGRTSSTAGSPAAVHPHSRGERQGALYRVEHRGGSSPLAWGEGEVGLHPIRVRRFIPTRVGRGRAGRGRRAHSPVHPHSRGERAWKPSICARLHGSSPLAWGEGRAHVVCGGAGRFIPTRVGR